ncbi:cytochrome c oxidase subunit 4 isoform 1, mitochondrial-like [Malaya genurostris]|uniref:cytochrome c oxidase subunit 4 isoform 1, mitochondrial-like n=1 Tax=Malaya genurostris TaxID=325434 RepID=UPI0026F3CF71|nr:cytochrome c oxidase subunit 4 isoform 1, mitochondrial-like [Malaya genurostris]XP_058449780.1 cytochrome c oxidase subunit 4 isoform 1, mitochondrial-like [Malaya genurostris]
MATVNLAQVVLRNALRTKVGVRQTHDLIMQRIGKREVVGYGWNGLPVYADRVDFPMPPIRFKEPTPDILALREKEKGDWKKLSIQEKKALYRASFCQTFAEIKYPTGEWKICVGFGLIAISLSMICMMLMKAFVYEDIPITFDDEHQKAQLKRMLDLGVGNIDGLSSKWDYENNKWK